MLRRLVEFSLRFRGVVVALACLAVIYGIYATLHAKYDVYPEFAPPEVVIQTEAPGLSPEEVEQLVTRPVESSVNGVAGLDSIRSQSIQGLSVVTVVFQEDTDIFRARQVVGERLAEAAAQIPAEVSAPAMAPLTSAASMVLALGLTSRTRSLMELRTFADWTLRPRLLAVPGVAKVVVFGGEVRQLQVQVAPDRLAAWGLSINDVLAAARASTGVRGAGFVETPQQRIVLRTEGQSLSPASLAGATLRAAGGMTVRLGDVARVVEAPEPRIGDAAINGQPGVMLVVSSQFRANTLDVTAALEQALAEVAPAVAASQITLYPRLFRPANFIQVSIRNIGHSLLLGGILVAAVLFLFLFNARTAFISLTAIPVSLLVAIAVLDRMGVSLNTLTLGGLAIAIGEVVDDAIIDVENIFRRLRENRAGPQPRPVFRVVLEASLEVRSAVVYATFVVALVFLPVLTMSGVQGRLFAPLALAYVLAILASLGVALTLTPALCSLMLARAAGQAREPRFVTALKQVYRRLMQAAMRRPVEMLAGALVLCAAALTTVPYLGGAFLPDLREGHFIVHMSSVPGTSLEETRRLGAQVTRELLRNPHILSVAQQIGRAEKADDTWGTHYSEIHVELQPLAGEEAEGVEDEIRAALVKFPGVSFAIREFLAERIEETISGVTAQVVIKIFGDDLDLLDRKAREVAQAVAGVRGAADVQVESPPGAPQIIVRLRPERLRQFGFRPVDVLEGVETAYQGSVVAQVYEAGRVSDVAVILADAARHDPEGVGGLLLSNGAGMRLPLAQLADVEEGAGRFMILHDGARRRQAVTCDVRGRDLTSFVEEARRRVVSRVQFPAGVYPVFTGAAQARSAAQREILLSSGMAAVGIVLLLAVVFGNLRNLLLVLLNLPFALVGGVLAVFVTGGWMTVGSLVGFVTLFGITTRNSIMLLSHYQHLVREESVAWGLEAALRGASERLVPILMTALVTALGLLPLALGSGEPGREIEGPMAAVILGGLVTSTLLNLLVLPALALRWGDFEPANGFSRPGLP
ncbi:MAG TPA: efflux RND transporter permease subunit [Bryobacteraceae bacterium]|nr:efflux RND transporter permease subunit [Bryobacteraceae bacterium]